MPIKPWLFETSSAFIDYRERMVAIVPTIGSIIKAKQPRVYEQLMAIRPVSETKKYPKQSPPISTWDVEDVMRKNSYRRGRGGIRQVGWDKS